MRSAADRHEFDILLVDDLSRLARDQVESERVIRRLEFQGIRIVATADGYDSQTKTRHAEDSAHGKRTRQRNAAR
jgi:DNA invertase Pin-like site-specific DNA recombinase